MAQPVTRPEDARLNKAIVEANARRLIVELMQGDAAAMSGVNTAKLEWNRPMGYFVRITDMALHFAEHRTPTFRLPEDWFVVWEGDNVKGYSFPELDDAARHLGAFGTERRK